MDSQAERESGDLKNPALIRPKGWLFLRAFALVIPPLPAASTRMTGGRIGRVGTGTSAASAMDCEAILILAEIRAGGASLENIPDADSPDKRLLVGIANGLDSVSRGKTTTRLETA